MSRAFRWLLVGLGCIAVVAVVSEGGWWHWSLFSAEEVVAESFTTGPAPKVVVDTFNGAVAVHTGATGRVAATVTKRGSGVTQEAANDDLENIDVQITREGDTIRVTAKRLAGYSGGGATVELHVPPKAILDLHTSNGKIETAGPIGDVIARSSNGQIHIEGSKGEVHAQTSNGRIKIEADAILVDAKTSNGSIEYLGRLGDREHTFHTSNGKISLALPSDSRFQFDARTSNGKIVNKFPTKETIRTRSKHQAGTVGENPICRLILHTSNGSITIGQEKSATASDDDDDDDDD